MIFWSLAVLICAIVYFIVRRKHTYWTRRGVKQREQKFLFGDSFYGLMKLESEVETMRKIYHAFPEERYVGFYNLTTPIFLLRDPELIKQIAVKDFDHFTNHRDRSAGSDLLWSSNLAQLRGKRWRNIRATLSPSFTSSKMKMIFNLFSESAQQVSNYFLNKGEPMVVVELKDLFTRFANDNIASVVFAVKCNSFEEPENEFYLMGKQATQVFSGFKNFVKSVCIITFPTVCKFLGVTVYSQQVRNFFTGLVAAGIQQREKEGLVRHDMIHLLLEARKVKCKHDDGDDIPDTGYSIVQESAVHIDRKNFKQEEITDLDIAANLLAFFFAGFQTVSNALSFLGYELALNPDIQAKVQKEIDETLKTTAGTLTYDVLVKMKYLDMVVSEGLRKWPPSIITDRECSKPYTIHPVTPGEKPVHFDVGDKVFFPIESLLRDPKHFPKPEVFDPERFNEENRESINPYTYLPFSIGPRNCVGSRFAVLEIKTVYFYLLSKFDLVVVEKTQIPLKFKKGSRARVAEKGVWVGLRPRASKE